MNILPVLFQNKINNIQNNNSKYNNVSRPKYLNTLERDTVTFTASAKKDIDVRKNKILEENSKFVSTKLCSEVNQEAERPAKDLLNLLKREFKPLVATESHPDNPIMPGSNGIKVRVKTPRSIREKALATRKYTKDELKSMGDVIGARIVLRNGYQEDFDKVFKVFGKMVKQGTIKIKEVENYRLTPKDSYISQKTVNDFEDTCAKAGQYPNIKCRTIPNGYTATHITVVLKDGFEAEIQLMGEDMEQVKDIEDFYYKLRCKKSFDPKYKSIEKMMKEKIKGLTPHQKETIDMYIKDSYVHARKLGPRETKFSTKDFFPWPYFLPEELSYAHLYNCKLECDKIEKAEKEAKKASKKDFVNEITKK